MKDIDKLAWLCIQDQQLLVARSRGKDVYYIPGGKRESGESDEKALIREIKEELSVGLLPHTIRHIHTFKAQAHGKPEGVMVTMACYGAAFTGTLKVSSEIEAFMWVRNADREHCSLVTTLIMDWLAKKGMIS